jgi:exodeoxyribonuclease VII large subunit
VIATPEEVLSVAELDRRLRRAVESASGPDWVEGEVSSLKRAPSGHLYFCLKDEREDAVIDCVMYRLSAERARKIMVDGARIQVLGRATIYAPRGRLQFIAEMARLAGRGALLEALEKLKKRLAAEGLFDTAKKRSLPAEPRVIGVVTSASGAAFHDICTVAFRRGGVRIVLCPAVVQGDAAARSLLRALDLLERYPGLDAIIIGRGGGSAEDLMAFNDERVVRRVAAARVPVVSAVGHEIDVSLTDLAADLRAATPSQAAELLIPDAKARLDVVRRCLRQLTRAMHARLVRERGRTDRLRARLSDPRFVIAERQQHLDELMSSIERSLAKSLARRRGRIEHLHRRLLARHPRVVIARARAGLGPLKTRLVMVLRMRLTTAGSQLGEQAARLDSLSPLAVLGRGYSIVRRADGRIVRVSTDVSAGDSIELKLHQGGLAAEVTSIEHAVARADGSGSAIAPIHKTSDAGAT